MACSKKAKCCTTVTFGAIFIVLAVFLLVGWPFVFEYILKSQLTLHENSVSYSMWKETPIPMYMDVYLFNWTNSDEVAQNWSIKPMVQQLGPYVFSEHHVRANITWNNNGTVTFKQKRTWHFLPEKSSGSLDDVVINLNPIASTVAYFVRYKHRFIRRAVDFIMEEKHEHIAIRKTAGELMFDGYEDELLDLLKSLNVTTIDIPFQKFGWFVERNESIDFDGIFTMYTGVDDVMNTGMVTHWNHFAQLPFYPGDCGRVHGTTGELFPPVPDNDTIAMFASDMCSAATLDLSGPAELHGIEGIRYSGTKRTFDNGQHYPEQRCFEPEQDIPTGLRNVSDCKFGAPAFLSFPHFYLADPVLQQSIDGLNATEQLHRLYLEVEPNTGLPLNVRARAQINFLVQPIQGIRMFANAKRTFMPMMWFEQRATLTEDLANQIKILLLLPNIGLYTGIGFAVIGTLILCIALYLTQRKRWDNEGEQLLVTSESKTSLVHPQS